ncbi:MAG: zinc ribbon domain-containing protein [Candidatus Heimdallarchaeota archaeon]
MSKMCINCGEEVKKTDIFCPFCGNNTDEAKPSVEGAKMGHSVCSTCNATNESGAKFCESCGNTIDSSPSSSAKSFGSTDSYAADSSQETTHTYGSYSAEPSDSTRKWYKPPKRTRSAKHPVEWLFWTGWGLYFLIRVIFWILFFGIRIFARSKGGRF